MNESGHSIHADGQLATNTQNGATARARAKLRSQTPIVVKNKPNLKPQATSRMVILEDLELSAEIFFKRDFASQKKFSVSSRTRDYGDRGMPRNEVSVMALNEICSQNLRGIFMWLPSARSLAGSKKSTLATVGMRANDPECAHPAMIFIDFVWTVADQRRFHDTHHSIRYLQSSFRFSALPPETPVYPVSFTNHESVPVYLTASHDRLTLIEAADNYYCGATADFEHIMGIKTNQSKPRIHLRRSLFEAASVDNAQITRFKASQLACNSLEDVYHRVLRCCSGPQATLHSTTRAKDILQETYTPTSLPTFGLGVSSLSDPKSRRGEKRKTLSQGAAHRDDYTGRYSDAEEATTPAKRFRVGSEESDLLVHNEAASLLSVAVRGHPDLRGLARMDASEGD